MPIHLLFLLTQDLQSPSGIGRYLPLAAELGRKGYAVRIAALHSNFNSLKQQDQEINGVPVHYVAPMHVKKQGSTKLYYRPYHLIWRSLYAAWQLSRAARRFPADIIHVCKPHPMNGVGGMAGKLFRPGVRLYLDCDDYEAASNRFSGDWQRPVIRWFEDSLPRAADRVTSNTHFTLDRLRSLGVPEDRLVYLPNGVDRTRFSSISEERLSALRAQLGLAEKRVVVYVGSLSLPSHPVDLLLRAFVRVRQRDPGAVLLIVGGGEDLPDLRAMAGDLGIAGCVCFAGRVPADAVADYYRLGDVSVDPVYDTPAAAGRAPLKMFESWAAGVPFVTVDVGDRRLLSGSPPAALLARPGNAASLAEAVGQVLWLSGTAEELRERGYRQVESFYWDRIVERVEWIYRDSPPRSSG